MNCANEDMLCDVPWVIWETMETFRMLSLLSITRLRSSIVNLIIFTAPEIIPQILHFCVEETPSSEKPTKNIVKIYSWKFKRKHTR
jgi:hypothetical protein